MEAPTSQQAAIKSLPREEVEPLEDQSISLNPSQSTNRRPQVVLPRDNRKVVDRTTRKITRINRVATKKVLSNTKSKVVPKETNNNSSSLISITCSRWISLRCRSSW